MGQAKPVISGPAGQVLEQTLQRWAVRSHYFLAALEEQQRRRMPKPGTAASPRLPDTLPPFEERVKHMATVHAESFYHARPTLAEEADEFEMLRMVQRFISQFLTILPLLPPEVLATIEERQVVREDWQVSDQEQDAALLTCILTQHFNAASPGERHNAIIGAKGLHRPGASLTTLVDPAGNSLFDFAGPPRQYVRAS